MYASRALELSVEVSVARRQSAIQRDLVTAIALGACRTVTLSLAGEKDLTHSNDYLHFFKRIGVITPESKYVYPFLSLCIQIYDTYHVEISSPPQFVNRAFRKKFCLLLCDAFSSCPVLRSQGANIRACLALRELASTFWAPIRTRLLYLPVYGSNAGNIYSLGGHVCTKVRIAAAMRAGRMIIINYSNRAIDLLLPEPERGTFDPVWCLRVWIKLFHLLLLMDFP